jgi:hypothetical protein
MGKGRTMSGKNTTRKSITFWIFFSITLGLLVFSITYIFLEKKNEEKAKEQAAQIEKEMKAKQEVQDLLITMREGNVKYDVYDRAYKKKWKENDLQGAKQEATKAYEQAKKLLAYYSTYKVPAVPEHVLTLFEGLESELSVAFGLRVEAFELILKHLDSPDPSKLKQAEDKFTESNDYFLSGNENIDMIQSQMGITLEK